MLVLMLPFIMLRRAPYPYTALLILLLTRKLCRAGEYAYDSLRIPTILSDGAANGQAHIGHSHSSIVGHLCIKFFFYI